MTLDLRSILSRLAQSRPVFHSEADFQHALAWECRQSAPDVPVRLEYRLPLDGPRTYADLWLRDPDGPTYVELKYWTRRLDVEVDGERFGLTNQAAQDLSRYDFIRDLERVEGAVHAELARLGYVIALTNDSGYWSPPRPGTVDAAFRLHDGRKLHGEFGWAPHAGAGTMRGRERPLAVTGRYTCRWETYSQLGIEGGEFRYLFVRVTGARRLP